MKTFHPDIMSALQARSGISARLLVWFKARDAGPVGLWSGGYPITIDIDGETRAYVGGALLGADNLDKGVGLAVRSHQIKAAASDSAVEALAKGPGVRLCDVEVHRVFFQPDGTRILGAPDRVFKGVLSGVDFPTGGGEGGGECIFDLASETVMLTRSLALTKSDEDHRARDDADRFRRYAAAAGTVSVYWGELRARAVPPSKSTVLPI